MPALPATIGRYLPDAVLGSGAMGVVYRARDPLLDRPVAVKVMRTAGLEDDLREEYRARFQVEARAAGRCHHPAIVLVHDCGETDEGPYIVLELVEGPTLAALLRQPGPRDAAGLAGLLPPVLDGLASAHRLGIVHRDIKPANLMVGEQGRAKIADFGVARLPLGSLTVAGGMLGTPSYMAPEQARGEAVDQRADLFGVAAVLYEILLGRPPFAGKGLAETLHRLTGPEAAELAGLAGSPLQPVLRRGLAKDPERRFPDAAGFATALREALAAPAGQPPAEEAATLVLRASPEFLDRLAADLRPSLGPIARALVQRTAAAVGPGGPDALVRRLADSLEDPDERRAFLRRHRLDPSIGGGSSLGSASRATSGSAPPSLGPGATPGLAATTLGSTGWPPAALAAVETALAFHIGPIARIFVKRAAAGAGSAEALAERLAGHLPDAAEAPAFRRKVMSALRQG